MRVLVEQRTYVKRVIVGTPIASVREAGIVDSDATLAIVLANSIDSAEVINLIDSAYVQARQVDLQRDSSFVTGILDSSLGALTNSIIPHIDSSIDLGSPTKKFRRLYLSGNTIVLGDLTLGDESGTFVIRDSSGTISAVNLDGNTTSDLAEGSNLYYTRARFDSALNDTISDSAIRSKFSASGDISYDSSTGQFSLDVETVYTQANFESDLSLSLNATNGISYDSSNHKLSLINTGVDSGIVGSSTQIPILTINAQGRIDAVSTAITLDSSTAINLIDSSYVRSRQITYNTSDFTDSAYVIAQINNLIDGAPGTLDTLNEIAAALNDDDSAYNTLIGLIATKTDFDSADAIALIDSAYVQLRQTPQDFAYSSLTGTPTIPTFGTDFVDSAYVESTIDSAYIQARQQLVDSASIVQLVDSTYVQARQITYTTADFTDSAYVTGLPVSTFTNDANYLDSTSVQGVIDASYIQARQTTYDFLDSSEAIALIDSAYVHTRQITYNTSDFADSAYVTAQINALIAGAPGTLDTLDEIAAALNDDDSAYGTLVGLINAKSDVDSIGSLSNVTYGVPSEGQILKYDSATSKFILSADTGGIDSAYLEANSLDSERTISLIDSSYVNARVQDLTGDEFTFTLVDSGAIAGPRIVLDRNSSSPADSDALANIEFRGRNSADSSIQYGKIATFINNATANAEVGEMQFIIKQSGFERVKMKLNSQGIVLDNSESIVFSDDSNSQLLSPGNYTADHVLTLPDSSGIIATRNHITTLIDSAYVQRRQSDVETGFSLDFADSVGTVLVSLPIVQAASIATGAVVGFGNSVTLLDKDSAEVIIQL